MSKHTHLVHIEYELLIDGDETEHTQNVNSAVNWDHAVRFEFDSEAEAIEFMATFATPVSGNTNGDSRQ